MVYVHSGSCVKQARAAKRNSLRHRDIRTGIEMKKGGDFCDSPWIGIEENRT